MRYFSINRFSPISQSIYQITDPGIAPIQQHLLRGKVIKGPYDWACFVLLAFCVFVKMVVLGLFLLKKLLPISYLVFYTAVDLIVEPCNILFYAIILRALMSWFNPHWQNPFASLLIDITEPILRTIRRVLPNLGMVDFSPLVAIILLKVIELLFLGLLPFRLF
jgi:YggT family protein